jgi:hypothetical protein
MGMRIFNTKEVLRVHFHFICLDFLSEYIFLCTDTESSLFD